MIVKQAEERLLAKNQDKEYAPIHGLPDFTVPAAKLAFGENSEVIKNGLVCIHFKTCHCCFFLSSFLYHSIRFQL